MLKDNDYEAYFGAPASPDKMLDSTGSLYTTQTSYLQQGPRERSTTAAKNDTSTVAFTRGLSTASSMAGWTVTSQLVQPHNRAALGHLHEEDDLEASSNFVVGHDYSMYDLPVYDIDDGHYTDVDLDNDATPSAPGLISSSTDPQLIVIANNENEEQQDDDDDKPRKSCLSCLCVRFLA